MAAKMAAKIFYCNLDGLESHMGYQLIKDGKTISEVGVAIRSPESNMSAKMAVKCIQIWKSLVLHPGMMHKLHHPGRMHTLVMHFFGASGR